MVLGAFFGILATIIYYKLMQCYNTYRNSELDMREMRETNRRCIVPLEDPNIFLRPKKFKEDEEAD